MTTILQLNKPCFWFVFGAEENLGNFSSVTNATLVGAILTTQTDALMFAFGYEPGARFVTATTVTGLVAQPGALFVFTYPFARLLTGRAPVAAPATAPAVHAPVFTRLAARRTVACTVHLALVSAHQHTAAMRRAALMQATLQTPAASTCTNMATI